MEHTWLIRSLYLLSTCSVLIGSTSVFSGTSQKRDFDGRYSDSRISNSQNYIVKKRLRRQATALSQELKDAILAAHNQLRNDVSPGASNMQTLEWSSYLEDVARMRSTDCDMTLQYANTEYDFFCDVGWYHDVTIGMIQTESQVMFALEQLAASKNDYDYANDDCTGTFCMNYKLAVAAEATHIGCSVYSCDPLTAPVPGGIVEEATLLTCLFADGNNNGRPYVSGEPCESCSETHSCCNKNLTNLCEACPGSSFKPSPCLMDSSADSVGTDANGAGGSSGNVDPTRIEATAFNPLQSIPTTAIAVMAVAAIGAVAALLVALTIFSTRMSRSVGYGGRFPMTYHHGPMIRQVPQRFRPRLRLRLPPLQFDRFIRI